jgi:hypothetical protein
MKAIYFLLFLLVQTPALFAQLDCKTVAQSDGSTVKKCYHKNGTISTIETWDKDKRFGNLKSFNNQGKELFSRGLRTIGGHASAQVTYFPNGQVKSIYYSDAPDGGIQYYNSTTQFDEVGNQLSFDEDKYPYELEILVPVRDTAKPRRPVVEINQVLNQPKEERIDFLIVNKTRLEHDVLLDYAFPGNDTVLTINSKKNIYYTVFTDVKNFGWEKMLQVTLLGNRKRFELIRGKEEVMDNRKIITWYLIKSWNYKTEGYHENLSGEK